MVLVSICGTVIEEHKKIISYTYEMNWSFEREKQNFEESVDLIRESSIEFTAANFFYLDRGTNLSIVNTIVSFLIVLTQFDL